MTLQLESAERRYAGLYYDPWMQALADEVARLVAQHVPAAARDYDNCDASLLPFYAYDVRAIAWTDTLGEEYARNSLKFADELNRLAGTEQGWIVLCQSLGSEGYVEYSEEGNGDLRRTASVDLFIVPPVGIAADAVLLGHLARVARVQTVPYTLRISAIHVVNRVTVVIYHYAAISPKAYKVMVQS